MNALRISFLVATDVAVIALFVSLLAGCVTTPSAPYRNGDFVSHMASVAPVAGDRAAVRPVELPTEVATRPDAAPRPARG